MRSQRLFTRLFLFWDRSRPAHPWVWLAAHAAVLVAFLAISPVRIDTELASILPAAVHDPTLAAADARVAAMANGTFAVLVGNADFAAAKAAALEFAAAVRNHPGMESLTAELGGGMAAQYQDFYFAQRYRLLPAETLDLLRRGDAETVAAEALRTVADPMAVGALARIDQDPFLLANRSIRALLGSSLLGNLSLALRDGVLAGQADGQWYVLVNGRVRQGGAVAPTEGNAVAAMRAAAAEIGARGAGTSFVWSGVPFHSYDSTVNTRREIETVTTFAMAATVLLLLLTFFSPLPLAATLATMFVGVAFGLGATFVAFREVHVFTIVFGASVIGISLDYSLYYFSERLNPLGVNDGRSIIRRSLPGISLALFTTLLSYAAFAALDFPLLRQMAVFSAMGLLSTFLTVTMLYPRLPRPRRLRPGYALALARGLLAASERVRRLAPAWRWTIVGVLAAATVVGLARLQPSDDLRALYKMTPAMMESERKAAQIMRQGSGGQYFLVRGASAEQALQREEALAARLDLGVAEGRLGAYAATSLVLPSARRQAETYDTVGVALMPLLDRQMRDLDFGAAETAAVRADFKAQAGRRLSPADFQALPLSASVKSLWIGQVGGEWFTMVMPLRIKDAAWLSGLADGSSVYYFNKLETYRGILRGLSEHAAWLLVLSYAAIFGILVWLYRFRAALRLFAVPVAACLVTLGALGLAGVPLNLFVVIGLIMVPGIGSDYAIFFQQSGSQKVVTMLAVFECMFGTVASFGSLGFSSLAGTFGLTVALGVAVSFVLSPCVLWRRGAAAGTGLREP